MRIHELLENKHFDDSNFVKQDGNTRKIDYDLAEDLVHFMHNDDSVYRRHVYPVINKCLSHKESKKKIVPKMFLDCVAPSYAVYLKEFPIRELPKTLSAKLVEKICNKLHDDFKKHYDEGLYND
jgi:hypothetical protein